MTAPVDMKPINVTAANFAAEVLQSSVPVVIDFWAPWCGPCRALAPVLDELAARHAGAVKVVKVNADDHPDLAVAFDVRGLPTLAAVHGGVHVDGQRGFAGRKPIVALFDRLAALVAAGAPLRP